MSININEKTNLKFYDLPQDVVKKDIETFLSQYKEQINSISLEDVKTYKVAKVSFKDNKSANDCRINMNLKKIKTKSIRILWDEKDFQFRNNNKNNLYIKGIPKSKTSREIYEYFLKFGDISSIKINEDETGNNIGTGFVTYYNQDDAKKAIDETNGKKIWDSDLELQYQSQYKNERNYHHNNDNLKININNFPEKFQTKDIQGLCEEFGKIQSCNIFPGQYGKYAIVTFSNEQEVKKAIENLNNKEIEGKKLLVKEFQRKQNYQQNNFYNKQYPIYEDPYENTNLYVRNIPYTAKEEDLRKTFEQFGKIKNLKIEKEIFEKKENGEVKNISSNKGYGYVSFENVQSAKKAVESLNGKYMQGFESWTKPLLVDFFISKQKRQMMENMIQPGYNFYGMQGQMMYPPMPGYPPQYPIMNMPFPNQFKIPQGMWHQGNFKNKGYGGGYKQKYNNNYRGRGGHRGGYYKNNHQRKNNNNPNSQNNNSENTPTVNEQKKVFNYEAYNKLGSSEEKKDFLGEMLFNAIQESPHIAGKNISIDIVGKITGMIIEIPNEKEIIEIFEKPSVLDSRILEALNLLNINK